VTLRRNGVAIDLAGFGNDVGDLVECIGQLIFLCLSCRRQGH
jgi:hypothetical protein